MKSGCTVTLGVIAILRDIYRLLVSNSLLVREKGAMGLEKLKSHLKA